jgi:MarR family transcriptional regulator, negative regulator of the multidrug operon emrRAB
VTTGWVQRSGPGGRRGLQLTLTETGHEVFEEMLAARRTALTELLAPLSPAQRTQLGALLETLLAGRVHDRADLERVCRLCERSVCTRCPVGSRLDRILAGNSTSPSKRS